MLEYKINEFLTLRLEEGRTQVYVKGKRFLQCKRLVLNISKKDIPIYDDINSIDEAANLYQKHLYQNRIVEGPFARVLNKDHDITPEQEFWGHCSNLQAWYENDCDTRLLHSNLAFNLLKALVDAGDQNAKRVLKTEVAERFESGYPNTIISIVAAKLLDYFSLEEKRELIRINMPVIFKCAPKLLDCLSPEEKKEFVRENVSIVYEYFKKIAKNAPNIFPYIFKERLLDYLDLSEKEQLTNLDYSIILDFMKNKANLFGRRYKILQSEISLIERIILPYLNREEIKQVIQQNFDVILKDLEKIWKHYPNLVLYFFEEKSFYLPQEEITILFQQDYPILLKYFKTISYENPDLFLSFFAGRYFNYLESKDKKLLLHQNYRIILNNIENLLKVSSISAQEVPFLLYPNPFLDIFEEELFNYFTPEEQKDFIQKNFLDLLIYIEKFSKDYLFYSGFRNSKISKKTFFYIYLIVLKAIKGTSLMDDFLNKIINNPYSYTTEIIGIMRNVIKELQSIEGINVPNDYWDNTFASFFELWRKECKRIQEIK
ncbi:MAG: hypothetical protein WBH31_13220 [Promethearchaeia archaeon]